MTVLYFTTLIQKYTTIPVQNALLLHGQFQGQNVISTDFLTIFRFAIIIQVHCCVLTSVTAVCSKATWNKAHCYTIASQDQHV